MFSGDFVISTIPLNTTLNIPALNLAPTFGDLDGDGMDDLIIGDADGKIHFFKNTGAGNFQIIAQSSVTHIDVGYFAQPQIVDVNRDGLNDIIIGEQNGTINYCPNTGTTATPIFDTIIANFGAIDVDTGFINTGFSSPKLIDSNGVYQLFVGSYSCSIYQFTNIDWNITGPFIEVNSTVQNIWDGGKCAFTLADITNDNHPEMILGNLSGGLSYFSSDSILISNTQNIKKEKLIIFPNPTKNKITISSDKIGLIVIRDLFGNIVYSEIKKSTSISINTTFLAQGIYLVQLGDTTSKLIIE